MRVACPECAAEYDLPAALAARIAEGRTVRCARCGTTWAPGRAEGVPAAAPDEPRPAPLQMPPLAPEPDIATPEPPPLVSSRPPEPIPAASRAAPAWGTGLAWAASLLLLAAAAGAAWYWRVSLVEAWPPAARAFMALGLAG